MKAFILAHGATLLIGAVLAALFIWAAVALIGRHKKGACAGGCASCPYSKACCATKAPHHPRHSH